MEIRHGRRDTIRDAITTVFLQVLDACDPGRLLRENVSLSGTTLAVGGARYELDDIGRIFVVGAGKASASMAGALEAVLGGRIECGVVAVQEGYTARTRHIELREAAHPVPDERSVDAARRILEIGREATEDDLVIALISGGGSALMAAPVEGVSLADMQECVDALVTSGADIHEINTVRKHLSRIKGGRLAAAIAPAQCATLILSDVVGDDGDDLSSVASGPTAPDPTTFEDALTAVDRYGLASALPASVVDHLRAGARGDTPETSDANDAHFTGVSHCRIGSARTSARAALAEGERLGWNGTILATELVGEAREVARVLAAIAKESAKQAHRTPRALIFTGETTVTVRGDGIGGRNQELALSAAIELDDIDGVWLASLATDGRDGPTDAAGAIVDGQTASRLRKSGRTPEHDLDDNDAYTALDEVGELVFTGPTHTNLNDLILLVMS